KGLDTLNRLKASLKPGKLKVSYADELWSLVDAIVASCADDNDTDSAFGYSDRARAPELTDAVGSTRDDKRLLTPQRLREVLSPASALLYYHVLPDRLLAWLITPTATLFRSTRVSNLTLTTTVRQFRAAISTAADTDAIGADLYDVLLGPFSADLGEIRDINI